MTFTLLKFDINKKVIAQWKTDHAPEQGLFDATNRSDGPDYMGRTYDQVLDTFSPAVPPPPSKRNDLKIKDPSTWTTQDIAEALQELL